MDITNATPPPKLFSTPEVLGIFPPTEAGEPWYIMVNLIPTFPATRAAHDGNPDRDGGGNHEVSAEIRRRCELSDLAARVSFDPEYFGTYVYGTPDDLAAVLDVIREMIAEEWKPADLI